MKIVFKDIGTIKFNKVVEIESFPGHKNFIEFAEPELRPYLPGKGKVELIPTDGLPELLANQYVVVYYDAFIPRGMGRIVIYN